MTAAIHLPKRYEIVWLDQHNGDPRYNHALKRTFFSHIDPETLMLTPIREIDNGIDPFIGWSSEIPGAFDNGHFTLRTFTEEEPCLDHIEQVKDDRILFIASNRLGRSAVEKIMDRYPNSFVNKNSGEVYSSIYIFCGDTVNAAEWAMDYVDYIQLFDNEPELLARMTRQLGNEFVEQGDLLRSADRLQEALERFSWAKSMYIRHEDLLLPCSWQPSTPEAHSGSDSAQQSESTAYQLEKSSKLVRDVDTLIEEVENSIKKEQDTGDSDQVCRAMFASYLVCSETKRERKCIDHCFSMCFSRSRTKQLST